MCKRFAGSALALPALALLAAAAAQAQEPPAYDDRVFSAGRWGAAAPAPAGLTAAEAVPGDLGLLAYPLFIPEYHETFGSGIRARVTVRGADDIRLTALRIGGLGIGPVAGYGIGPTGGDTLSALGGFLAYRLDPFIVDLAYSMPVAGEAGTGYTLRFGAGVERSLSERMAVSAHIGTSYAAGSRQDPFAPSGLGLQDTGAGFRDVGLGLGLDYRLTERVMLRSRAGYTRLLEDAAGIPLGMPRDRITGALGLTYTFGGDD